MIRMMQLATTQEQTAETVLMAWSNCEDYSGLAREAAAHEARGRALLVHKQPRFVVSLYIRGN
jgi:hypothetical protein